MNEKASKIPWRVRLMGAAFVATAAFLNHRIMGPATNLLSAGLVMGTVTAPLALLVGVALLTRLIKTTEQPDRAG